jgi:hypothetical protein
MNYEEYVVVCLFVLGTIYTWRFFYKIYKRFK